MAYPPIGARPNRLYTHTVLTSAKSAKMLAHAHTTVHATWYYIYKSIRDIELCSDRAAQLKYFSFMFVSLVFLCV